MRITPLPRLTSWVPGPSKTGEGHAVRNLTNSKVLKVLKVLNFSGAGEGNIFMCTFTDDDPRPDATTPRRHPVPGPVRRERGIAAIGQLAQLRVEVQSVIAVRGWDS